VTTPESDKQQVRQLFERIAQDYDNPSTRFFPFCADRLVNHVKPRPGTRALDVATGTGAVAVPLAQAVGSTGRVHAIDFSDRMLDRAEANIRKMALDNIDLHLMDAQCLDFRSDYFHTVVCSYSLFFIPDMQAALNDWVRVLRAGGRLAFTSFETSAFQPMLDDFGERLQDFGVQLPEGAFGAGRITSLGHCREMLEQAGLVDVHTELVQLGYHLRNENDWWEVVTSTAMRALLDKVPADRRDEFRDQHLAFVAGQSGSDGLWMDVQTRFASGSKPDA
jgi:ubiquinone/menaquinone biosynthesis C-methylase UbiE